MATHSSTLALKIPWTEELGAGYYPWGHKESGMTERLLLTAIISGNGFLWQTLILYFVNVCNFIKDHLFTYDSSYV